MAFPALTAVTGLLSPRLWKILGVFLLVLAVVLLLNHAVKSYGDAREQDGVNKEKAAWEEADRKLQIKVAKAQTEATASAIKREERHAAAVQEEREKIDEAVAEGRSPLDVLFGS